MIRFLKNRSVFFKLILVFIVTGLLLNFVVFGIFRALPDDSDNDHRLRNTAIFLIESMLENKNGPLNSKEAARIKEDYAILIRFESADQTLKSYDYTGENTKQYKEWLDHGNREWLRSLKEYGNSANHSKSDPENKISFRYGNLLAQISKPYGKFLIVYSVADWKNRGPLAIILAIVLTTVIITLSYLAMRSILSPVKLFMTAVSRTSSGDFDYKLPDTGTDEFGKIGKLYNEMQYRIDKLLRTNRQLLFDVSHEVRTPLTRMKLQLAMMPESEKTKALQSEIDLINQITEDVLAQARSEKSGFQLTRQSLKETIQTALDPFIRTYPNINFDVSLADLDAPHDRIALTRAIQNLIENAIRHNGDHTCLHIKVGVRASDHTALLQIEDNGKGIDPAIESGLFDPFRKSPESEGTGLGLSIVKRIIEAHPNGSVTYYQPEYGGAGFLISLPVE